MGGLDKKYLSGFEGSTFVINPRHLRSLHFFGSRIIPAAMALFGPLLVSQWWRLDGGDGDPYVIRDVGIYNLRPGEGGAKDEDSPVVRL